MIYTDKFSARDWDLLTRLPFRIGLWMADSDEGGGEYAFTLEMAALEREVKICQSKYENIPLIRELMESVAQEQPLDGPLDSTLADAQHALDLLKPHCGLPDLNCFKLMLIDIAEAVARAAANGRLGSRNLYGGPESGVFGMLAKVVRFGHGPKVSKAEKIAINQLIEALDAENLVRKWDLEPYPPKAS